MSTWQLTTKLPKYYPKFILYSSFLFVFCAVISQMYSCVSIVMICFTQYIFLIITCLKTRSTIMCNNPATNKFFFLLLTHPLQCRFNNETVAKHWFQPYWVMNVHCIWISMKCVFLWKGWTNLSKPRNGFIPY